MTSLSDRMRRVLIIAPHPDDEVLGCGGTMMRLAEAGAEIHVAIVTRASPERFGAQAADIGRAEACEAHKLLRVRTTHFLDFPAAELDTVPHAEVNRALGQLMTDIVPDTLFIPFVGDVHLDHQLIFLSAMVAARPRDGRGPNRVLAYETLSETNWYAPGVTPTFAPNVYIDIGEHLEAKIAAFGCYASQVKAAPDERAFDTIRALAVLRGATVHRHAAEAFMLLREID